MRNAKLPLTIMLLAASCTVASGCAGPVEGGGAASCGAAAPRIEASPVQAAPKGTLRLHGEGFYGEFVCNDTGIPNPFEPSGGRPTDGIRIELVQGARTWTLATVTSGKALSFDAEGLEIPTDAASGEAVVRATSPSVVPEVLPPQAETPFLVLDHLPETGGPKFSQGWQIGKVESLRSMFSAGPHG